MTCGTTVVPDFVVAFGATMHTVRMQRTDSIDQLTDSSSRKASKHIDLSSSSQQVVSPERIISTTTECHRCRWLCLDHFSHLSIDLSNHGVNFLELSLQTCHCLSSSIRQKVVLTGSRRTMMMRGDEATAIAVVIAIPRSNTLHAEQDAIASTTSS